MNENNNITMRAKLKVEQITSVEGYDKIDFKVAYGKIGDNQIDEDNTYSKFTPTASASFTITNPELIGKFRAGQKFYVDFTPVIG